MFVEKGKVRMPDFIGGKWINSDEINIRELKGNVVLVLGLYLREL